VYRRFSLVHSVNGAAKTCHSTFNTTKTMNSNWAKMGESKGKDVPCDFFKTEHHAMKAYWGLEV
jgi:hypothetical protein